jgi:hydrogenase small subunit
MRITRRQFLKYCGGSAAALGLTRLGLLKLSKAFAAPGGAPVIWLQAAGCSGCSVSLLNKVANADGPAAADLLLNTIDLKYHPTVMAAAGDLAVDSAMNTLPAGGYFLVVEGAIPTARDGVYCHVWEDDVTGQPVTALEAVQAFSENAAGVIACGTCAAFGGIPAGHPNPTGCRGVSEIVENDVINIPGCPPHPDWIIGTIAYILTEGRLPSLDGHNRPRMYYGETVHTECPNRLLEKAEELGQIGCLQDLGCNGQGTHADCPSRKWNGGINWCIGARNPCQGCTEPSYPDGTSPFYRLEKGRGGKKGKWASVLTSSKA